MRFSSIFLPLAVLSSLVLASPVVEEREKGVTVVESNARKPDFKISDDVKPVSNAKIGSDGGGNGEKTGVKPGVSKRSDYNELDGRAPVYFIACTSSGCRGSCYGYIIRRPGCYATVRYHSAYVSSNSGLPYGVYASLNCRGLFALFFYSPVFFSTF